MPRARPIEATLMHPEPKASARLTGIIAAALQTLFAAVTAPTATAASSASAGNCVWGPACPYKEFHDGPGHYHIVFPEPLIRLAPPEGALPSSAAHGSRESFMSADRKFQLEVWTRPNTQNQKELDKPGPAGSTNPDGWRITYRAGGDSWMVNSGYTRTGHVFYERTDFMCGRSTLTGFVAVYPSDPTNRARFDPWISRIKMRAYECSR